MYRTDHGLRKYSIIRDVVDIHRLRSGGLSAKAGTYLGEILARARECDTSEQPMVEEEFEEAS